MFCFKTPQATDRRPL